MEPRGTSCANNTLRKVFDSISIATMDRDALDMVTGVTLDQSSRQKSRKKMKCLKIQLTVDYLSKWVETKVAPTYDAEVMLKYGVNHGLSTVYHPQTSGQVEVSNRDLKRILERTIGKFKTRWTGPFTIAQVFPYGTIELSQTDGPNFKREPIIKEWEDRMEKAATTTSSLEAEQDSGSGPRCQDTILGGAEAQIRFEAASKQSNDPPLLRVNTLGSGEDNMKLKELMEFCTKLSERALDL
ncbi:reverse transcriptase domain-containing protein [Tanacetum coccineum]